MTYYPRSQTKIRQHKAQQMQLRGINLTDNYTEGQLESSKGITSDRFPYISTSDERQAIDAGIPSGYQPVSIYAAEKLFVVSDCPSASGSGYRCYYGGQYVGDINNLDLPKQYAVVGGRLVVWPDKVMFNIYDTEITATQMHTATLLADVREGTVVWKEAAE